MLSGEKFACGEECADGGKSCSQTRKQLKVQNLIICHKLDDTCTCYSFKHFKNITDSSTSPGRRVPRDSHYLLNKKKAQTNKQTHTYTHTAVKAFQRATQSFSHWDENINNSKRKRISRRNQTKPFWLLAVGACAGWGSTRLCKHNLALRVRRI